MRARIDKAIDSYRLGDIVASDDPWQGGQITRSLRQGQELIGSEIRGQNEAALAVLDILKRSAVGMTGAHTSGSRSRPKGVLFFAGPSGVGKTMMAKKIAELVFGNPEAYCRFDMSEFRGEHSGDRLIGAPPGYIGHDQGGELTNAIREQPFRVLLFDEIEKADGKILDKFLQILEDGRLTDGRGQTVYFLEVIDYFHFQCGDHGSLPSSLRYVSLSEKIRKETRSSTGQWCKKVSKDISRGNWADPNSTTGLVTMSSYSTTSRQRLRPRFSTTCWKSSKDT